VKKILPLFLAILAGLLTGFSSPRASETDPTGAAVYRLSRVAPPAAGLDPARLKKIDAIVKGAIREGATPGAVVLVLRDGEIVFDRAYGHHTYERDLPTRSTDIFDLASITKISATTLAVMRLVDEGKLDVDATVGTYLSELKQSHPDKAAIRVRDLLTHQAGFVPAIPFYTLVQDGDHRPEPGDDYPIRVSASFYLKGNFYREVMWPKLLGTPLKTPGTYVYSDLGMYVLKEIVERIVRQQLDDYVEEEFYRPLGACTMGFCPSERHDRERLVPTGIDGYFRKQLLHGFVQDSGAALSGGVAGHAGLFATAYDLALVGQMLLNGGSYDGREYFRPETVRQFTARQSATSRRGLGFDRFDSDSKDGYPARLASPATFGHTGYTGTCLWIDPERRLVYVFLSNRTYPRENGKLQSLKVRARVLDAIYEAMGVGEGERPARLARAAKGKSK
jgi:CubicO group peptidase (beta-lactamase class C family)